MRAQTKVIIPPLLHLLASENKYSIFLLLASVIVLGVVIQIN